MRSLRCDHGENETHELGRRVLGLTQATRSISVAFGSSSLREENELSEEGLEWDRRDHGLVGPWGEVHRPLITGPARVTECPAANVRGVSVGYRW